MREYFEKMKDTQAFDWIPQEKIAELLADTDLVITRGSATTLAEIDTFRVKKIIIPLPYAANNHQYWNAKEYEKNGDILLDQKNINQLQQEIGKI
jgi:UDP-N-acetylglucosamine--N-acetylmuramyl-(pentapeptide) pyrophosphoryl-undecaprenol N-acetylglucosamine transferase